MALFSRQRERFFKWISGTFPSFGERRPHSLAFLNISQFLGAMNDNMFKLILVFMVIDVQGQEKASVILSAAGAIFVIPFLLFSSVAGSLADRFSKQKLLVGIKIAEMSIMFLALFAFAFKSVWAGYTLLFLLATHSALLGPAKYGIISEIVPPEQISRANGLITGFTYLAMIFGTFFASFLTEVTDRRFVLTAGFCLLMSVIGFISTFGIKKTLCQDSKKEVSPYFLREIYHTLRFCKQKRHLLVSIFGSAYFLFIGAFTQLNIIPYAIQSLNLTDVFGGYLFLSTAFGIVLGSYIGGRASKKQVELGLACLAGIAISLCFLFLGLFSSHLIFVITLLVLLGVFGGIFIIPFDTFTQITSPQEKRGQVIAAANFLSFCGVLLASFALYLFSDFLELSSATGFGLIGICTLFVSFILIGRLSDLALPYLARKLVPVLRVQIRGMELIEENPSAILLFPEPSLKKSLILFDTLPNVQLFIPVRKSERQIGFLNRLFYSLYFVPQDEDLGKRIERGVSLIKENLKPCFLISSMMEKDNLRTTSAFERDKRPVILLAEVVSTPGSPTSVRFSQLKD